MGREKEIFISPDNRTVLLPHVSLCFWIIRHLDRRVVWVVFEFAQALVWVHYFKPKSMTIQVNLLNHELHEPMCGYAICCYSFHCRTGRSYKKQSTWLEAVAFKAISATSAQKFSFELDDHFFSVSLGKSFEGNVHLFLVLALLYRRC